MALPGRGAPESECVQAGRDEGALVILPGIDHSWIGKTPEATKTASVEALQKTFDFIDATIGDR